METIKTIGINFIILLAGLIILDLIVGAIFNTQPNNIDFRYVELREHKPNSVIMQRPYENYLSYSNTLVDTIYEMRIDSDGFIKGAQEINKDNVDIIFFGGSTTECEFVSESIRFPYLVGQKLNDKTGKPLKTLNGGRSGNNSIHSLIQMMSKGLPYRPKFMVILHNINDLTGLTQSGSYWKAPPSRSIIKRYELQNNRVRGVLRETKNLLIPNIYQIISNRMKKKLNDRRDEWLDFRPIKKLAIDERFESMKKDFESSLRSFIAISRIWGSIPVLMTQASRHDLNNVDEKIEQAYEFWTQEFGYQKFVELYMEFNEIIRMVAKEEDVVLIDLDKQVPKIPKYIFDEVHFNNEGSKLAAEIISTSLINNYPDYFKLPN